LSVLTKISRSPDVVGSAKKLASKRPRVTTTAAPRKPSASPASFIGPIRSRRNTTASNVDQIGIRPISQPVRTAVVRVSA
jgi:hypothetical protein